MKLDGARPIPCLALRRELAAASLDMSLDSFEKYVQPHVRLIRRGRLLRVPVSELERWCEETAEDVLA